MLQLAPPTLLQVPVWVSAVTRVIAPSVLNHVDPGCHLDGDTKHPCFGLKHSTSHLPHDLPSPCPVLCALYPSQPPRPHQQGTKGESKSQGVQSPPLLPEAVSLPLIVTPLLWATPAWNSQGISSLPFQRGSSICTHLPNGGQKTPNPWPLLSRLLGTRAPHDPHIFQVFVLASSHHVVKKDSFPDRAGPDQFLTGGSQR